MSGLIARLFMASSIVIICFTSLPAFSQTGISLPPAPPPKPVLWRSDAAVVEAEKMILAGKYADALTLLEQAIARNLHNVEAHVHTGLAWYHLGNNNKAKEAIKSAQIIDSKHIGSYVIAGMIALKEQQPDRAADYLRIIRILCQGETCPEFQTLSRMVREAPPVETKAWYHF